MALSYGSFNKLQAENVIFDSTGTTLTAENSDEAIRQLDTKIEDVTASGIGGGGGSSPGVQPQVVVVNPNIDEIEGETYKTWANADAYIQTQTHDSDHRWVIQIDGVNNENIVVRDYITILGTSNTTTLTGQISSTVTFSVGMDTTKARIIDCILTNVHTSTPYEFIQFHRCYLTGGTPTLGFLQLFDGAVNGGNYTGLSLMQMFNVMVLGGTFPNNVQMLGGELYNGFVVNGGEFSNTLVSNQGTGTFAGNANYVFDRCKIETDIDVGDQQITLYQCTFDNTPTITIGNNGSLFTHGVPEDFDVSGDTAHWYNSGNVYKSPTVGFDAPNMQSAIDKLVNRTRLFIDVSSSNGTLTLDLSQGSVFKTTLTEHTNVSITNTAPPDTTREITLIVQQPSGVNYSLQWDGYYCEGGTSPNIAVGSGAVFIYKLLVVGSNVYVSLIGNQLELIP